MRAVLLVVAAVAWGCSPALNWRDVTVGPLTSMLPCKPDRAQREVQLGEWKVPLSMSGCEADGKLFAISWFPLSKSPPAESYVALWKEQALARMNSASSSRWEKPPSAPDLRVVEATRAAGRDSTGKAVEARLVWLASHNALFHIAVYGPRLDEVSLELLTSQLRLDTRAAP